MIKKIKFPLLFLGLGFLVWFVSFGLLKSTKKTILYHTPLQVGKQELYVKVAKTLAEQTQGFSGADPISDNQGMLFDFTLDPGIKTFWMKDMNFDLDLIWIQKHKIIGITQQVPHPKKNTPESKLSLYHSPGVADMVLEVNSGWAEKNKIKVGDAVRLIKN
jgi:uncharacterized membrane protein (UPF0127 family)